MIKPVLNSDDYLVSDESIVWSRFVFGRNDQIGDWRRMKLQKDKDGYLYLMLYIHGRRKTYRLSRLVYEAFTGEKIPEGLLVRHWDGNKLNNLFSNLLLGTHQDNMDDMLRHGTQAKGTKQGSAKLNEEQVIEIRKLLDFGMTQEQIATKFNVDRSCIGYIASRRSWRHV